MRVYSAVASVFTVIKAAHNGIKAGGVSLSGGSEYMLIHKLHSDQFEHRLACAADSAGPPSYSAAECSV